MWPFKRQTIAERFSDYRKNNIGKVKPFTEIANDLGIKTGEMNRPLTELAIAIGNEIHMCRCQMKVMVAHNYPCFKIELYNDILEIPENKLECGCIINPENLEIWYWL